ncbi:MAG: beta-ketoacyl-ACP synthase II [Victivallaceae bacterium]
MSKKRVVVTGMGLVSALGNEVDAFYEMLLSGKSAIRPITHFPCEDAPTRFAGWIDDFESEPYLDRKQARRVDPFIKYAIVAAKKAAHMAGWEENRESKNKHRCGVIIGAGMGGLLTLEEGLKRLLLEKKKLSPFFIPFIISNMAGAMIAMDFDFMGPNYSISTACATSNYCIEAAYNYLANGYTDLMFCGGAEAAVNVVGLQGFIANKALSERNDEPTKASRPWDRDRDGFVLGEGAGVLVLETLDHALARGAPIIAEILGAHVNCDAFHMTSPRDDGEGIAACVRGVLKAADIPLERVNYINAHGTSTPLGDIAEVVALRKVFGDHMTKVKMNSTKSLIGHCLGAAGGIEAIATLQAIVKDKIHPTINVDNPIAEVEGIDLVRDQAQDFVIDVAMSNSFGFGGHNSIVLFSKYKP